jgi:hypothetical protein
MFHLSPDYSTVHVVADFSGWDDAVAFGPSFPVPLQSKNSPPPAFSNHPRTLFACNGHKKKSQQRGKSLLPTWYDVCPRETFGKRAVTAALWAAITTQ